MEWQHHRVENALDVGVVFPSSGKAQDKFIHEGPPLELHMVEVHRMV